MTGQGGERSQDADACVHREPDAESQGSQSLPRSCPQAWLRSHADFSPTGTVRARAPDRSEGQGWWACTPVSMAPWQESENGLPRMPGMGCLPGQ